MKPKVQNVKLLEDFTSDETKTAKRQVINWRVLHLMKPKLQKD